MDWVSLNNHSQYSILDAITPIKSLVQKAKEFGMESLALTDHGNLFGAVDFYKACVSAGIKPILGCEFYLAPRSRLEKSKERGEAAAYHLTLLAKNITGYHNLIKLSSLGYIEGFYYYPRIDKELLEKYSEGLICLSGSIQSSFSSLLDEKDKLIDEAKWFQSLFKDDFYFEIQRHQMTDNDIKKDNLKSETWLYQNYEEYISKQTLLNQKICELSNELGIKLVAINDSHYLNREDYNAHEILINVQSGEPTEIWEKDSLGNLKQKVPNPKRRVYSSHEHYFKSPTQMKELFNDLPDALSNSLEIANKCSVEIDFDTKHYPVFVPPKLEGTDYSEETRVKESEAFLAGLCRDGIKKRYTKERLEKIQENYPNKEPLDVIQERLKMETDIICSKGMCDYILIVYDFIHWSKENGIPVGPGRGSGAGSIILYLIGITDIEPLRFNLFFERFINPERVSYPDIDVDICMDKREQVIEYTLKKYGAENVAQIITFGTMKAKMSVKDVGRVLNVPLSKVNQIAKLIPDDLGMTLSKALEVDPDLKRMYDEDSETHRLIDNSLILEGSVRNTGVHAAGVVVSADPLTEHIPIFKPKDSDLVVTQLSMKPLESVGMLKMDFLGLKTLTSLQMCVDAIEKRYNKKIDWADLPLDDAPTFELLNQGKTLGVFQLESAGMADLAVKLHIDKFEEVIAAIALYRPGPMSMIPSFINRKHGKEAHEIDHPWMEDILKKPME